MEAKKICAYMPQTGFVNLKIFDNHFLLCCRISNAIDGSRSPYKGKHSSNRSKQEAMSDGEDPFEGLDGDDEDIDFAEFSEPEEKYN